MAKRPVSPELPNRIRALRKAAGLSLVQLGERAGIHFANLQKLELGRHELKHYQMRLIAPALGVEPADLLNAEHGGLTSDERELIDTYRELPIALQRSYDALCECYQPFRGAPEPVPAEPS